MLNTFFKNTLFVVCMFVLFSCKKDFGNHENTEQQFDYNKLSLELKWALSANSIWINEIDSKVSQLDSNISDKDKLLLKMTLFEPISVASNRLQDELIKKEKLDRRAFYSEYQKSILINKLDSVNRILENKDTREYILNIYRRESNKFILKQANTIPEVVVTACRLYGGYYTYRLREALMATGNDFEIGFEGEIIHYNGQSYGAEEGRTIIEQYNYLLSLWRHRYGFETRYNFKNSKVSCDLYFSELEMTQRNLIYELDGIGVFGDIPIIPDPYFFTGSGSGGSGGSGGISVEALKMEVENLTNTQNDPITNDKVVFYLIAQYKGSVLLDRSQFSRSYFRDIGRFQITSNFSKSGELLFFTAGHPDYPGHIVYLIHPSSIGKFEENIRYYDAGAKLFYMNGMPSDSQIEMVSGDRVNGLLSMWGESLKSPEYWAYLIGSFLVNGSNPALISKIDDVIPVGSPRTVSTLQLGQRMHAQYKAGLADNITTFKEYNKIPGIRPDFVDFNTRTIYELKPNNPRQIKAGNAQLEKYKQKFEETFGETWTVKLELY